MLISIIIPAFNAEQFIARSLNSIFCNAPTLSEFEVIIINDGSNDKTTSIIDTYCKKFHNITLINKNNEGVSIARNVGINAAKGKYVLFLDADDELIDGALKKTFDYLSSHETMDMLVTRQYRNNGKMEWIVNAPTLEEHKRYYGVEAFQNGFIRTNAGGGICNRAFLNTYRLYFPDGVKNGEDTIFFGLVQVYAKSIVYYNLPLYRIFEIEGSASRTINHTMLGKNHIRTMLAAADAKDHIKTGREEKTIFDCVIYMLVSNTIAHYTISKDLTYKQFRKDIPLNRVLPLDIKNMYIMQDKARLLSYAPTLFYFLSWIKHKIIKYNSKND